MIIYPLNKMTVPVKNATNSLKTTFKSKDSNYLIRINQI